MASMSAISCLLPHLPRFMRSDPFPVSPLRIPGWKNPTSPRTRRRELPNSPGAKRVVRVNLSEDAPFVAAIGASILLSLAYPVHNPPEENEEDADARGINFTDARFGVMTILSVIPYFNWMCWIFAWLDTGRQRYLVYSVVYLAPYIRTNLSISPDESWLPIASILVCIFHVQLEESIRNGDINAIQLLRKTLKLVFPSKEEENGPPRR